jgi:hypothetical protein
MMMQMDRGPLDDDDRAFRNSMYFTLIAWALIALIVWIIWLLI